MTNAQSVPGESLELLDSLCQWISGKTSLTTSRGNTENSRVEVGEVYSSSQAQLNSTGVSIYFSTFVL